MKRSPVATTEPTTEPTTDLTTSRPTIEPAIEGLAFDDALGELQQTVAELEAGGQPLEAAIALYERGVALQGRCERLIRDAELRVEQLVARAGGALETRAVHPEKTDDRPPDEAASGSR